MPINDYFNLLGVSRNATLNEIKKAYRKKAKELHPDKNKAKDAQQKFIELTEAYEFLLESVTTDFVEEVFYEEDLEQIRRQKAQEYAQMRYEAFIKTDFYINDQAFLIILEHIESLFYLFFMTAPILGVLFFNTKGLWVGLLICFCTLPLWTQIFKTKKHFNITLLLQAIKRVSILKETQLAMGILFNIILFFSHTLKTVVSTRFFIWSFVLYASICVVANLLKVKTKIKYRLVYIALPFLFNYFFWINYTFSSNPNTETYYFKQKIITSSSKYSTAKSTKSTTLILKNHQYQKEHFLRMFYNYEQLKNKNQISYHFEKGFFGFKVLKSYSFNYRAAQR